MILKRKVYEMKLSNMLMMGMSFLLCFAIGCTIISKDPFEEAQAMVQSGEAQCVLLDKNGDIVSMGTGHGVMPLLRIYEASPDAMKEGVVVDKVIGRAAAAIIIWGGAKRAHGELMSEDALEFLTDHDVSASYTVLVPRILNRKRDGLCPLEASVIGITNPQEAVNALKLKIQSLQHK